MFKPTDYESKIWYLDQLQENDVAFIDVDAYKIKYIPAEYRGNFVFKTISEYNYKYVSFYSDLPVRVFFA